MTRIIQISDLHFGTEKPELVNILTEDILQSHPDVLVISGDLTQRALLSQFQAAKKFLAAFKNIPVLSVPGSHDISIYNLVERFLWPLTKFNKYISSEIDWCYQINNLAILGLNSATPYKIKSGHLSSQQLEKVFNFFNKHSTNTVKIVVMNHNLIQSQRHKIMDHAENILSFFNSVKVNIILSRHLHYACLEKIKRDDLNRFMYIITAGTAISTRLGTFNNSYNVLDIQDQKFTFFIREFKENSFFIAKEQSYSFI